MLRGASSAKADASPHVAHMVALYVQHKMFGGLPDEGGLLDQRADIMAFFMLLARAEREMK